jgi:LDH2 family malate/lactate/ureidoglycolate dehydrogenase
MRYSKAKLKGFCMKALMSAGVCGPDAATVANVLLATDERGVHSHGCVRIEGYIECLKSGGIKPNTPHEIISEGPAFALINANRGLGIPVSVYAMRLAKEKAEHTGIALVNVRNSHHFGACGYYTLLCADDGLIGLAMSTGDVIMAATGSACNSIGNNPFSYAVPAGKYRAICYDIAMSTVAAGKISMADDEGKRIPLGWLLDPDGNPTTDPHDYAMGGPLVPFGGYKGYGLSMMVESLAGILSGAALLNDIHAWNKDPHTGGDVGHCFIAIDPKIVHPGFDVPARAEEMIDRILSAKKAEGVERIYFPGQIENEKEETARAEGMALPPATEHALERAARITDVPFIPAELEMKCSAADQ